MHSTPAREARLYTALKYGSALAVVLVVLLCWFAWRGPTGAEEKPPASAQTERGKPDFAWQGVASCSAAPCHHGSAPPGKPGNEFAIWFQQDRHARAYEVLTEETSKKISRNLRREKQPHEDGLCLRCHVDPNWEEATKNKNSRFSLADGVGCESCHGPAQTWLAKHYRKDLADAEKRKIRMEMKDTRSLSGRVRLCLDCHVGAPGQEVDHDLIAAGHPALRFEFGSYHALLPRHWDDRKDRDPARDPPGHPDFEVRAWVAGQAAAGQAALRLLAARASKDSGERPWPEFAEYDCFSCHHELQASSRRQATRRGAGTPLWGDWYFSGLKAALRARARTSEPDIQEITGQVTQLKKLLERWNPAREVVANRASALAERLERQRLSDGDDLKPAEVLIQELIQQSDPGAPRSWDSAAQAYLGVAALQHAWKELHPGQYSPRDTLLRKLKERLDFPGPDMCSPSHFVPGKILWR
jgi:hypothetical protein